MQRLPAAAHAVLDVIADEKLCERATEIGRRMTERLQKMAAGNTFSCMGDVRGLGAMVAVELVKDRATREPDTALTNALIAKAQENGLILLSCGPNANVIRLLAPLTIPFDHLEEGLDILERSLAEVFAA
jgi:4-aminobutyrate aminotransferase